ncbi:MAG TPA: gliding motility-associated C-terminal domain-containing protein [Bacteroidia bacterium]
MKKIAGAIVAILLTGNVFGQIFSNTITGTNPNTANPYTTGQIVDANITVSGIGRGPGITGTNANNRYNANGWSTGAIDLNDYFEFTLTPNSGCSINFTNFIYASQVSSGSPSHAFRSSVDGFTANIGTPATTGATIDLSAAAYQNVSSAITFRFYTFGIATAGTTFSINDFTFNGTTGCGPACTPPSTQASAFVSSGVTNTTADISWTAGNGGNAIVLIHQGSAVNADPNNGSSYTANTTYSSGSQVGSGNYVVYNGTGNSVTVTGLTAGTQYFFAVYEYDPNGGSPCYNLTELSGNITTTGSAPVSSCFQIESILVDACNDDNQNIFEYDNEMIRFKTGNTAVTCSQLSISSAPSGGVFQSNVWPTTSQSWHGVIQDGTTAAAVSGLNNTISGCGFIKEPAGCIIPPNSTCILVSSPLINTTLNSFANLNDTIYMIFQGYGASSGQFGNCCGTGTRSFCLVDNASGCRDTVVYQPALITGGNGGAVEFTANGTPTYVNHGCQAPIVLLNIEAGNNTSVCANGSVALTGSTTSQYTSLLWSGGTGTFTPNNALNTSYSPGVGESGIIKLYLQLNTSCGSFVKDSLMLTINPAPTPTVTSNINPATICDGGSITLTASGGTSFLWSTTATTNTITVSPTTSTVYTVDVTNSCGTTQATFSVTVNNLPAVTASNTGAYCAKDSIHLDATAGYTYSWSGPNSFSSSLQNPFIPNAGAVNAGTYSVQVTDNSTNCQNSATTVVVINALPVVNTNVPPVTITPATCGLTDGSVTGSNASGTTPFTYQWISSAGVVLDNDTALNNVGAGVYYLAATDGNGCRDSVSFTVTTSNGPAAPTFTTVNPVCEGGTFSLSVSNAIPGATYSWVSSGNPTLTGVDLITITVDSASASNIGPYTVEVASGGCSNFASISGTLNMNPIPAITGILDFCAGKSTVLDAGSSLPSSGNTYVWLFNSTPVPGGTADTLVASAAGNYQVQVSNSGCDSVSAVFTVSVNPLPVLNTLMPPVIITDADCGLSNGSIAGANATGSQPLSYQWTNGLGTVLANDTALNVVNSGSYYLVATDNNGCIDSAQYIIGSNPGPVAPTFAATGVVCEGSNFTLTVTNPVAGATYSWAATGLTTQTGVDLTSITVTGANAVNVGPYTVTVMQGTCSNNATVSATLHALPDPQLTAASTAFCSGDSLNLVGTATVGITYQWYLNGNPVPGATNDSYYASQAGSYELMVDDGTCDSISAPVVITENSLPPVSAAGISVCLNSTSNITANGAQTYSWTAGTTPSTGATVSVPTSVAGTSSYTVTGTDGNGCKDTAIVTVVVNSNPVIMINSIQNDTIIACENTATTLTASGANSFVWSTTQTINPISFSSAANVEVSVVGTDLNGCVDSTKIQFVVNPAPITPVITGAPTICNGYPTVLHVDTVSGQTYSWSGPSGVMSTLDSVVISSVGSYSLTTTNGCGSTILPITIGASSISASFDPDTTIGLAPLSVGFTNTSANAGSYYWDFGNGQTSVLISPSTVYTTPGTYTAYMLASNAAYCYASYSVQIIVLETNIYITMPNVFSPNNDNLNDYFGVQSYGIKSFSCEIYNRWGILMTTLDNVDDKWTPASSVSEGTYFYMMKAKGIDDKDYSGQGYILLTR